MNKPVRMKKPAKVMIVDDSPVFRALLNEIISSDPDLEVVAMAEDPYQARSLIKQHNPDVLTLDIEMPKMNGVQFLKNLMRLRPMPVVMISTLTQHGADATLQALELGAVDYFPKPSIDDPAQMVKYKQLVNEKVKMAAGANVGNQQMQAAPISVDKSIKGIGAGCELIAIGASTGGTEAIRNVLSVLPDKLPPIVITQHISELFTASFAERLNSSSKVKVSELQQESTPLIHGCAYVAPGNRHMVIVKRNGHYYAELDDREAVNRHKPSVDVMFDAISETVGQKSIGVILTGMGQDGAQGMLKMKQAGAFTIAQDEHTSVVWGMPRVAVEIGAAGQVAPLDKIPKMICDALKHTNN